MLHSLIKSARSWASRFCSTTNTRSCSAVKSTIAPANGNARTGMRSRKLPRDSSDARASATGAPDEETDARVRERERAYAEAIQEDAARCERCEGFGHRRARRSVPEHAGARGLGRLLDDRAGHQLARRVELAQQPLHVVNVRRA